VEDPSLDPDLEVNDLILDLKSSQLSGIEPFSVSVFVKVNMQKYDRPMTKVFPDLSNSDIKLYKGEHTLHTVSYKHRKEDYIFKILVRDHKSHWQIKSFEPISVEENPPDSLIKRFSIDQPMLAVDTMKHALVSFDLLCDNNVKYVKWIFDDKSDDPTSRKEVPGYQPNIESYDYRKKGIYDGRIEVYKQGSDTRPEIRTFQIIVLDYK